MDLNELKEEITEKILLEINNSANNDNLEEFANKLARGVQKLFPKSYVSPEVYRDEITLRFALGKNREEWGHYEDGTFVNANMRHDPAFNQIFIRKVDEGVYEIVKEPMIRNGFVLARKDNRFSGEHKELPIKTIKGDERKITSEVVKWFKNLKTQLKKNRMSLFNAKYHDFYKDKL
jgi:hypothetical protein